MSDQFPPPQGPPAPEPTQPMEPTAPRSGRRTAMILGGSALSVALVAGAGFAAVKIFTGDQEAAASVEVASAMPASTVAMATVSLEPDQLVEAVNTLNKFPAFADSTDVDASGDVLGQIIDAIIDEEDDSCGLSYDTDFKPWLGSSAGVGIIPEADGTIDTDKDPRVFAVLETLDADKAQTAFDKFNTCAENANPDDGAWTFVGDNAVLANDQETLDMVTAGIEAGTLAESDTFNSVMGTAGDSGLMSAYLSPSFGSVLSGIIADGAAVTDDVTAIPSEAETAYPSDNSEVCEQLELSKKECAQLFPDEGESYGDIGSDGMSLDNTGQDNPFEDTCPGLGSDDTSSVTSSLDDFPGVAMVARFSDGGFEIESGSPSDQLAGADTASLGASVTSLPADTAAAFGFSLPDTWVDTVNSNLTSLCGDDFDLDGFWTDLSDSAGLTLPNDLTTLFGDSTVLSLGGGFDPDQVGSDPSDPFASLPIGLKIHGDTAAIQSVLDSITDTALAGDDSLLTSTVDGDVVVVSPNDAYRDSLVGDGGLGASSEFTDAVPNADDATMIFFLNANALDQTVQSIADTMSSDGAELVENFKPFKSLGVSAWTSDGASHSLVRLTTD